MNIFIADILGKEADLRSDESWHCAKVLRKKSGDTIYLIDGLGNFYTGRLELVTEKKCRALIIEGPRKQPEASYHLHLAIAPTKNIDRIEWMLEKCVEIGIQELSFFTSRNSERQVLKMERIRHIVESAVKQSLQARIPLIHPLKSFQELLQFEGADQKYIAHCHLGEKKEIRQLQFAGKKTLVLVGPEGDFTLAETEEAAGKGFEAISLGQNRLRTETAGLFICQTPSILSP
ncbi:MAG: 16S rRNA (uracil(1498)-N(3))-methyltransferase [Sphingobacteriia bacterium]|nr:16S rRNA (uracil(1498)-N(3))-methyltransferase [Sphingobacteriia bacterium]